MKLQLEQKEIEAVLLDCFCSGGLSELNSSGIDYCYNQKNYEKFAISGQYYEDNLINLLKGGGRLKFVDMEDKDNVVFLTMELAQKQLSNIENKTVIESILKMDEDNYNADAWDGYNVLQYLLYNDIIFG
jgi:hypothetical protein